MTYSNLYCKRVSDGEVGWTGPRAVYDLDCGVGPRTVHNCSQVSPLSVFVFVGDSCINVVSNGNVLIHECSLGS